MDKAVIASILVLGGIITFIISIEVRKAKRYSYGNGARNAAAAAAISGLAVLLGLALAVKIQLG